MHIDLLQLPVSPAHTRPIDVKCAAGRCTATRSWLRFNPAASLTERAALSVRREVPTRLDQAGPPWTRLDQAGPPWTRGGGPEVGDLKSPVSAIAL